MRYANYEASRRAASKWLMRMSRLRKSLRDEWQARRTYRPGCGRLHPVRVLKAAPDDAIPLITNVRDEAGQLPSFLEHYRGLGVRRFLVVDDRSGDGTRELLLDQPDVDLYSSELRYRDAGLGTLWHYDLAHRYGIDRWYVLVDADEYLVYDGMARHGLSDLAAQLEARKLRRLLAPMIDLYPSVPLSQAVMQPAQMPWEVADHFDASGYSMAARPYGPLIEGGGMTRVFGDTLRQKFPLLYWDRRTSHSLTIHFPLPYGHSPYEPLGALLHFKCFSDLRARAIDAVVDNQHASGAMAYRRYFLEASANPDLTLMSADSVRYEGPAQLRSLGLIGSVFSNSC